MAKGDVKPSVADEWRAGCFSRLTFSWLFPLIRLGYSRALEEVDVGALVKRDHVSTYLSAFEANIRKGTKGTIRNTIWKTFSKAEYYAVCLKFTSDLCSYIPPLCINFIVSHSENPDQYGDKIFIAAGLMLFAPFMVGLCNHWWYNFVMIDGLHARTTIQAAVYAKVLRISNSARTKSSKHGGVADTLINLQSTDCRSIEMVYWMWMYTWAAPLQVVVTTVLLYLQLGWSVFLGIAVLVLLLPVQKSVMGRLKKYTKAASESSDQRIKLITEIVHGVQVVKLQAWEGIFAERVQSARSTELKHRRSIAFLQGTNTAITECAAIVSTLVTFIVYGLVTDTPLTAAKAFTTLALFNILRTPLMVLPMLIGMVAGGTVAAKRLADFLYSDEIESYVTIAPPATSPEAASVEVKSAEFVWTAVDIDAATKPSSSKAAEMTVSDLSDLEDVLDAKAGEGAHTPFAVKIDHFVLKPGTLTVVAGKVGSGKSSFLSALLGEMSLQNKDQASVCLSGTVAYCAQESWIQNATVRDNILFGQPFDQARYNAVLSVCALETDIAALPGGDQTEIGERGINLSGGQKARISLGRACYSNADIIVLDDILSAVDAHVARHITDKCLVEFLRGKGKTVLLATHQSLCFPDADTMIVLAHGEISFSGSFTEAKANEEFSEILGAQVHPEGEEELEQVKTIQAEDVVAVQDRAAVKKAVSAKGTEEERGKLTDVESKESGAVTLGVYTAYARMAGYCMCFTLVALAVSLNAQQIIVNWWLSRWSVANESPNPKTLDYYLSIYFGLGLGACSLIFSYQILAALGGLTAASRIHGRMFTALLGAPLAFFDTTPSGRLLNLFTADMKAIDETLAGQLSGALSLLFMMLSVLAIVVTVIPLVILPIIPLFAFYGWIQLIYRNTARELKRFDSTTQSPVFNHFAETVNGLSSIRAFRCEERMLRETTSIVDYNSRFWTKNNFVNRWLGLRLDWIGAGLVGFTALACVLAIKFGASDSAPLMDPGLIGLVLSYTSTLTGLLNWGVRRFSEAEQGMVAVERTRRLFVCPQESTTDALETVPENWPDKGEIKLSAVSARYRPGLPTVLKSITFTIPKHTKVGVCGRTGSGKTTLAKLLFRLMEVEDGKIEIDGLDISRVELPTLRRKITMIPQDPTLFAGPLRYSLDPAGDYSDEHLWGALERVGMMAYIEGTQNGLDAEIVEGGENLSAGQRQLLCMARALLETPKVLVMDEATSNIDGKTDDKIQSMLKDSFKECTVLTIAHRIDTIVWYDKVLVLDGGEILEYDDPKALAKKTGSAFGSLLDEHRRGKGDRD
jgi:ABC-type multidrug transport system fused ATPase/permease subunit